MPFPRRTFTADEGQPSTGAAGPDAIEYDLDNAFAMFNPMDTLRTGEPGGIDANENIRNVQVDQNQKPDSDTGKIPALLSGIVNRIKAIMGTPDWKNDPPTTLAGLANQISNVTVNQNATPQGDTGNIQQLLSWIVNRIRAITGRGDWKEDPAVNLQTLAEAATHEDISYHALSKTTHGVQSPYYIAKTSRSDQLPSWNDIPDKPTTFPVGPHQHSAQDIITGQLPPERIGNLPASKITSGQFSPDRIPNLPASKITSGTFDAARLPAASTSQRGIVQLTNSRSSTSETLAVTAAALNAHRTSADHDDRYYTKAQVDQMLAGSIKTPLPVTALKLATGTFSGLRGTHAVDVHRYAFASPLATPNVNISEAKVEEIGFVSGSSARRRWLFWNMQDYSMVTWTWDYVTASGQPRVWAEIDDAGNIYDMWEAEDPADPEFPDEPPFEPEEGLVLIQVEAPDEKLLGAVAERLERAPMPQGFTRSIYAADHSPRAVRAMFARQLQERGLEEPPDIREVLSIVDRDRRYWYLQLYMRQASRLLHDHRASTLIPLYREMCRVNLKTGKLELR